MKELIVAKFSEHQALLSVVALIFGILLFASLLFFVMAKLKPTAQVQELKTRTRSWWVMVSVFVGLLLFNTHMTYIALGFLSFIAFRELYSLIGFRHSDRRAIFWALLSIPVQYYLAYIGWYEAYLIFIPIVMFLLLPLRLLLKGDTVGITQSMAVLQWTLMLTVFGLSHTAYLLSLPAIEGFASGGQGLLLFLVFLTEINDVSQFTWGKLLGRHKVFPTISPNKTWEGLIGGVLCTTVIGYFLVFLTPLNSSQIILVSFLVALAGFVGDVVMSSIKRDVGVKDTGSAIPGHGGVLDRIDSLIYTAPTFFHLVYYMAY